MGECLVKRIVSCFTNCYGPAGVWAAAEQSPTGRDRSSRAGAARPQLRRAGHPRIGGDHRESRRCRPSSRSATTSPGTGSRSAAATSAVPTSARREGLELTERRIRFAARWFGVADLRHRGRPAARTPPSGRSIVENLRRLGDTAAEHGVTLALETHKGPTQNATAMLALDGRGRPSRGPPQLRYRQHRLLQSGRRSLRRARAGQAPGPQRPPQGQSRRLRGLVLPGPGRGGSR